MTTLYLDNHLLVVSKPPGMLSQGDITRDDDLVMLAKAYLKERFQKPGNVFVGLVHRLDRPSSGVLALARTSKAAGRLSDQFRKRSPEKRYLAVVTGALPPSGEAVDGIDDSEPNVRIVAPDAPGAKRAVCQWQTLASDGNRHLVEVTLETGRKHQIRAQLAARGAPVVGDLRYGSGPPFDDGRGIALHAWSLAIDHPTKGERLTFTAPPPPAWQGLFDAPIGRLLAAAPAAVPSPMAMAMA